MLALNQAGSILVNPSGLALCSAFLFALSVQLQNLGLRYGHSRLGALISIFGATSFYWVLSPFFLQTSYWTSSAIIIFAAVGLFRPFLSVNLALAGVRYLGPTLTSTLSSTAPLFAAAFAVLILGERLTVPLLVGTIAIVVAVGSVYGKGETKAAWPTWALLLPIFAASLRALGHAMTKLGLNIVPDPLFAGLTSYTVSLLIAAMTLLPKHQRIHLHVKPSYGLLWFFGGGILNGVSIWSLNAALNLGDVVKTAPIVSLSPIFTFLLGFIIFRREVFNLRIIFAMILVVPAVMLIAATD